MIRLVCFIWLAACGGGEKHPAQPPQPSPPDAAVTRSPDAAQQAAMPDDCVQYVAALDRMSQCEKLPDGGRKAIGDAKQAIVGSFANAAALSADALVTMTAACKQANDAIQQAITSSGC